MTDHTAGTPGTEDAAQRTASAVTYQPLAPSAAGYADYAAPDGVTADFYRIASLDGRTGIGVHLVPAAPAPGVPLVISVHGSGGSITSQPVQLLSTGLAAQGVPVLAINTRQSDEAVNTDLYYATVRDIEAAYFTARALGYERIVLHGHSLGTSQVAFFAATHWYPEIVGIVLTGMFADLPWKSRHLLINDEAAYARLTAAAIEAAQARDFDRVLPEPMRWLGGVEMPVTAQHFLSYRRTVVAGARSVDWIARVPYPLLMVRDSNDPIINYFEPGQLEAAVAAEGISPSVTNVLLESEAPSNGHAFEKSGPRLVERVRGWLDGLVA
ncbi:MAG TPA: alpha/beta fold hydrolase [Gryllotalpicola sp.]